MTSLPKAPEEVRSIAGLMKDYVEVTALTGPDASESAYLEKASGAGYLHFAVHSIVDERFPDYSSLVLAGDDEQDGFLQSYEILRTPLNARLVVLSGCETGLGRLYRADGLVGLKRAFLVAGARSIVASLWSIEDATVDFMSDLYARLAAGESLSRALRETKLAYLEKTRPLGSAQFSLSHPFFWASMTLTLGADR